MLLAVPQESAYLLELLKLHLKKYFLMFAKLGELCEVDEYRTCGRQLAEPSVNDQSSMEARHLLATYERLIILHYLINFKEIHFLQITISLINI